MSLEMMTMNQAVAAVLKRLPSGTVEPGGKNQ
jgi:hypothetical protein